MSKSIAFAPEVNIGTPVTPTTTLVANSSDGIQTNMSRNEFAPLNGTRFGVQAVVDGQVEMSGSLEMAVDRKMFAYLLTGLFGVPITTPITPGSGTTNIFKHEFSPNDNVKSITIEQWNGKIAQVFAGVLPTAAKFSFPIDNLPTVSYELLALSQSTKTTQTTPTWDCDLPYNHTNVIVTIDGRAAPNAADVELSFEADTKAVYGYPKEAQHYRIGRLTVTGSLTYYLEDTVSAKEFYEKYLNGELVSFQLSLNGGKIGDTDKNYSVAFDINKAALTKVNDPMDDDMERFELEFTATVDCETQNYASITLVNDNETYVAT